MIHFADRKRQRYCCHPYEKYVRHYYVRETLILDDSNIEQYQRLIDEKTMSMNAFQPSDFSLDYQLACGNSISQLLQPATLQSTSLNLTNYFEYIATLEKPQSQLIQTTETTQTTE